MFTSDDIRSVTAYLKESAKEALSQEPSDPEGAEQLIKVARQFEVIRYNPFLFQDILDEYDVDYAALMAIPVDDLPMHINDAGVISKAIVKWRLSNNV